MKRVYMTRCRWMTCCWTAAMLCLQGCGQGAAPPLGTVTGLVTLDGKPLSGARISFGPEAGGRPSTAITNPDGTYRLQYSATSDGVLLGRHIVRIFTVEPEGEIRADGLKQVEIIPVKYHAKSILFALVESGKNKIDFALDTKK